MFKQHVHTMAYFSQSPRKKPKPKPITYTEREEMIINGEYVETLRRGDVNRLIDKAERKKDFDIAKNLQEMYDELLNNENYYLPHDHEIIEGVCSDPSEKAIHRVLEKAINNQDGETVDRLVELYHLPNDLIDPYGFYSMADMTIIKGDELSDVSLGAVERVMKKAVSIDDYKVAELLADRYGIALVPVKKCKYTLKEARDIFDRLDQEYEESHKDK